MEVILLEKIANLGALGDRVTVKAGYGRNYLIPQAKAVAATADNLRLSSREEPSLKKKRPKFCRLQRLGRRPLQHSNSRSLRTLERKENCSAQWAHEILRKRQQTQGWNSIVAKSVSLTDRLEKSVNTPSKWACTRKSRRH